MVSTMIMIDWLFDINGNGKWDADLNEPLNDDLGLDGVGPLDDGYTGPDQGEGDGLPTSGAYPIATEFPGEPNIDKTDKDESDQIGLTAVSIYRLGDGGVGGGWPKDDEPMWQKMVLAYMTPRFQNSNSIKYFLQDLSHLVRVNEKVSMDSMFGNNLEDLIFNKEKYRKFIMPNYNFLQTA